MRLPLIAFLLAVAASGARGAELLPDFTSFTLLRMGGVVSAVSAAEAADTLKNYDVIFVGELHDHIANHLAEMALLRALQARAPGIALSMEQFERDVQAVLDDYLAGRIGEETLAAKGRAWKNYPEAYRPLVEFAREHKLAVIAANAPEKLVRCVGREGAGFLATLSPVQRAWAAAELHTEDGPYKRKYLEFLSTDASHGGPADAPTARTRAENSFAAQVTRDDTMAESIALYLRAHPGGKVLHVTGAFHAEDRLGTIERLKLRLPDLKIALVLPVEADNPAAPTTTAGKAKGADFAILLRPEPESYASDEERKAAESSQAANIGPATSGGCKL